MKPLILLVLALFLFLIIAKIRELLLKPEAAIKAAFQSTKYQKLLPFVIAQAKHETGGFTSSLFIKLNNMFGMKTALIRAQQGKAHSSGFRQYATRFQSALDFLHWLHYVDFQENITSPELYVKRLKQLRYFEDTETNYLNGLKTWL